MEAVPVLATTLHAVLHLSALAVKLLMHMDTFFADVIQVVTTTVTAVKMSTVLEVCSHANIA